MSVSSVLRKTDFFTVAEKIGQYVRQGQDVTTIYPVWNAWSLPLSDWCIFSISSGYFIQCNVEPGKPLGKYGRARLQYLKEHRSNYFTRLLLSGKLYVDLNETDAEAQRLLETIIPAMAKQAGVTEKLKAVDPSQWIGMMNVFKAQVEEMIWKELICV